MRLSIRWKWTLAVILATVTPLLIVYFRAISLQRDGLRNVEQELEAAVVDQLSSEISGYIDNAAALAQQATVVALDPRLPAELRTEYLRELVGQSTPVGALALYSPQGEYLDAIIKEGAYKGDPLPLSPKLLAELRSTGRASRVELQDGRVQVRLYAGKHDDDDEDEADDSRPLRLIACATIDDRELAREAKRLSEVRFSDESRIDILTWDANSGRLRSVIDPQREQPPFLRISDEKARTNWVNEEFVRTAEFVNPQGELTLGTVRTVPEGGLAITVTRPASEAYVALGETRRQFLIGLSALALLAVLVGALIGRSTTRPIGQLVAQVKRYSKRDWQAKSAVRTGDELQTLGEALDDMADKIQAGEQEIARRAQIEQGLSRYLPSGVAQQVARGEREVVLGGERKELAILFADVANFTRFAEEHPVEDVVQFLNELFGLLSEVVFRHGGLVDKFMGDCVMALFGVGIHDDSDPDDAAARAVAAAEDMQRFVEANSEEWKSRWGFEVQLGIGVALGPVLVGNLGSDSRMEFTAVGDSVNVASRLENIARPGQVLVTSAVVERTKNHFDFQSLGDISLRGKSQTLEIFQLRLD